MPVEPVCSSVCDIVDEVCHAFRASRNSCARELINLLGSSHLRALLETHDAVVERRESPCKPDPPALLTMPTNKKEEIAPIRVVGLRRQPDEPLVSLHKLHHCLTLISFGRERERKKVISVVANSHVRLLIVLMISVLFFGNLLSLSFAVKTSLILDVQRRNVSDLDDGEKPRFVASLVREI